MTFRVLVQVLTEHLDKAIEEYSKGLVKFAEIHKIPFEDTYLLDMQLRGRIAATDAVTSLIKRGVAFNIYGIGYIRSVRFNRMGELVDSYVLEQTEVAAQLRYMLTSKLWPDGCSNATASLRAGCVGMRFEWEDQLKNGRRYAMLHLLGK